MATLKAAWTPPANVDDQVGVIVRDGNPYGDPVFLEAATAEYQFEGPDYPEAEYEFLVRGRTAQIQATVTEVGGSGSGEGGGE